MRFTSPSIASSSSSARHSNSSTHKHSVYTSTVTGNNGLYSQGDASLIPGSVLLQKRINLRNSKKPVEMRCMAPIGDQVWVGGKDGLLVALDAQNGDILRVLQGSGLERESICIIKEVRGKAWIGTASGRVMVWDPATGRRLRDVATHNAAVSALSVVDGQTLWTGSQDRSIRVWNIPHMKPIRRIFEHKWVSDLVFIPSLEQPEVWVFRDDGTLRIRSAKTTEAKTSVLRRGVVRGLYTKDDNVWAASKSGAVCVLSAESKSKVVGKGTPPRTAHSARISAMGHNGSQVWTGSVDRIMAVYDEETGRILRRQDGQGSWIMSIIEVEKRIWSLTADGIVSMWSSGTWTPRLHQKEKDTKKKTVQSGDDHNPSHQTPQQSRTTGMKDLSFSPVPNEKSNEHFISLFDEIDVSHNTKNNEKTLELEKKVRNLEEQLDSKENVIKDKNQQVSEMATGMNVLKRQLLTSKSKEKSLRSDLEKLKEWLSCLVYENIVDRKESSLLELKQSLEDEIVRLRDSVVCASPNSDHSQASDQNIKDTGKFLLDMVTEITDQDEIQGLKEKTDSKNETERIQYLAEFIGESMKAEFGKRKDMKDSMKQIYDELETAQQQLHQMVNLNRSLEQQLREKDKIQAVHDEQFMNLENEMISLAEQLNEAGLPVSAEDGMDPEVDYIDPQVLLKTIREALENHQVSFEL
eukprot:gb/GECH01006748.1/.p1 GENE.gb/GECH01006748.1/~~gb/GECH01006748.1/.p1  ORF type:complete len:693 (+),score=148.84 gb/GECH01006748.1/:1-2079(+)